MTLTHPRRSPATTSRSHNQRMELHFGAIRAGHGARDALAHPLPDRAAVPVFPCAVEVRARAPITNPSQPSTTANFYEIEPVLADGTPFEPGTPLPPGLWTVQWTCPLYPARQGGAATGAFHVAIDVAPGAVPAAWAANEAGPIEAPPPNIVLASTARAGVVRTLRALVAAGARAEAQACEDARGFVAHKTTGVVTRHRWVFDEDDAMQEGMRILLREIRKFSGRGRPKACWTTAAGLVLERDLPRAADKVSGLPAAVARFVDWLRLTDLVDLHDPALTPESAAAAYAADQRRRRQRSPRTRSWLVDKGSGPLSDAAASTWRRAIEVARAGEPVSLDGAASAPASSPVATARLVDRLPLVDPTLDHVGEATLDEAVDDFLVGTSLEAADVWPAIRVELDRGGGRSRVRRGGAAHVEQLLLSLVARPGEDVQADEAALRRRVASIVFDERGAYRPTDERARRWRQERGRATGDAQRATGDAQGEGSPSPGGVRQLVTADGSTTS